MDFVSNEFQQSHEGSFFGRKNKKEKRKKKSAKGGFFSWFVLFCLYISQVCYRTLLNEREGWTRKSGQVRSGLAGHAVPTYIGTLPYVPYLLPYFYMYILGMWTGDDDSLIYWKYINILQPRSEDIESGMFEKKKKIKI